MACIRVSAPAHLHAGNYELTCNEEVSRCYGTIGVAVSKPRLVVRVCLAPQVDAYSVGGNRWCRELEVYARLYAKKVSELVGHSFTVELIRCYPWGAGLGARTPLALAVAEAARRLVASEYSLEELALMLGRGWVSGLGYHAFTKGGLIVDAGFEPGYIGAQIPPLLHRSVPQIGLVVVLPLAPLGAVRKLKENAESLERLLSARAEPGFSSRLARLAFTGFLGNLVAGRLRRAFAALEEMNRTAGEYWRRQGQAGIYCCPEVEEVMRELRSLGAWAVIQSSWGPSLWGVYPDIVEARRAAASVSRLEPRIGELLVWATSIDPRGAIVEIEGAHVA